jgi:hypothetical protein
MACLEVQDWRGDDDGQPRIEIVAKRDGPEAVGEEEIRLGSVRRRRES